MKINKNIIMKTIFVTIILTIFVSLSSAKVLHKPGEVIVKFRVEMREELNLEVQDNVLTCGISSLDTIFKIYSINNYNQLIPEYDNTRNIDYALDMIYVFTAGSDDQAVASIKGFERDPFVEYAELNIKMESYVELNDPSWDIIHTPNDPYFPTCQWYLGKISAQKAWDIQTGDHDVIVAIVDDGCERDHPDLAGNYITGYDFVDTDDDPTPTSAVFSHGTHCAGLAAAVTNNNIGIASIGYRVGLIGIRTAYYASQLAQGIDFSCQNGADVLSMSWGSPIPSSTIISAIYDAYDNYDVVCIASAGNDNSSIKTYPAACNKVVAVAASDFDDIKASFSNYGDWIDISAPGDSFGYGLLSTVPYGTYEWYSGTSMSCPLAAGLVALMRCQFTNECNILIIQRLYYTTDSLPNCSYYNNGEMGAGRINAFAALSHEASGDTTELIYDDGIPDNYYYWSTAGFGSASRLTIPFITGPYQLLKAKIFLGNAYSGETKFTLKVFDWGDGQPNSMLMSEVVTGIENQWNTWDISTYGLSFNYNDNFVIAMFYDGLNIPTFGYDYINNNRALNYSYNSWNTPSRTYFFRAYVLNLHTGIIEEIGNDVVVESIDLSVSRTLFTGSTTISYTIPSAGNVNLSVYDLSGREIRTLVNWYEEPGLCHIIFDGKDNTGYELPTGTYICNIVASSGSANTKLIIVE